MNKTSYYVGVLLAASRNPLNTMQLFLEKNNGKVNVYSRISNFNSEPDTRRMRRVGSFSSVNSAIETINSSRQEMSDRGLSVPGVKIFSL